MLLADGIDVVGCIGRRWNKVVEVAQIFRSADLIAPSPAQLRSKRAKHKLTEYYMDLPNTLIVLEIFAFYSCKRQLFGVY